MAFRYDEFCHDLSDETRTTFADFKEHPQRTLDYYGLSISDEQNELLQARNKAALATEDLTMIAAPIRIR